MVRPYILLHCTGFYCALLYSTNTLLLQASGLRAADPAAVDRSKPGGGAVGWPGLGGRLHAARH